LEWTEVLLESAAMGDSNSPVLTETRRSKRLLLNRIILHHQTSIDPLQEVS
jgi:hypothetical protein